MSGDTITHESRLSLRLTLALCGSAIAVAGAWYHMTGLVQDVRHELKIMNLKIEGIVAKQDGHVDRIEFRAWVRELKALNPSIAIPLPD